MLTCRQNGISSSNREDGPSFGDSSRIRNVARKLVAIPATAPAVAPPGRNRLAERLGEAVDDRLEHRLRQRRVSTLQDLAQIAEVAVELVGVPLRCSSADNSAPARFAAQAVR